MFGCHVVDLVVGGNRQPGSHTRRAETCIGATIPLHRCADAGRGYALDYLSPVDHASVQAEQSYPACPVHRHSSRLECHVMSVASSGPHVTALGQRVWRARAIMVAQDPVGPRAWWKCTVRIHQQFYGWRMAFQSGMVTNWKLKGRCASSSFSP